MKRGTYESPQEGELKSKNRQDSKLVLGGKDGGEGVCKLILRLVGIVRVNSWGQEGIKNVAES